MLGDEPPTQLHIYIYMGQYGCDNCRWHGWDTSVPFPTLPTGSSIRDEVIQHHEPVAALYENVAAASQRSKGPDGQVHQPPIEVALLIYGAVYL